MNHAQNYTYIEQLHLCPLWKMALTTGVLIIAVFTAPSSSNTAHAINALDTYITETQR